MIKKRISYTCELNHTVFTNEEIIARFNVGLIIKRSQRPIRLAFSQFLQDTISYRKTIFAIRLGRQIILVHLDRNTHETETLGLFKLISQI